MSQYFAESAPPLQLRGCAISKPDNEIYESGNERPCEDRIAYRHLPDGGLLAALSDGAGGEGIFAAEWAAFLLEQLPNQPPADAAALRSWLQQIAKPFYIKVKPQAEQFRPVKDKLLLEGSNATLAAVWCYPTENKLRCHWLAYGDSVIFHQRQGELTPLNDIPLDRLAAPPVLLNWRFQQIDEAQIAAGELYLLPGDALWLASDGLANTLLIARLLENKNDTLIAYLNRYVPKLGEIATELEAKPVALSGMLEHLSKALADNQMPAVLYEWHQQHQVVRDDYALIHLLYPTPAYS